MSGDQLQMVGTSTPPSVAESVSTSNNTTALRVVQTTKQIHQRVRRSNTLIPDIIEVEEPPGKEEEQ